MYITFYLIYMQTRIKHQHASDPPSSITARGLNSRELVHNNIVAINVVHNNYDDVSVCASYIFHAVPYYNCVCVLCFSILSIIFKVKSFHGSKQGCENFSPMSMARSLTTIHEILFLSRIWQYHSVFTCTPPNFRLCGT